jgi:hypothetical protein
MSIYEMHLLWK